MLSVGHVLVLWHPGNAESNRGQRLAISVEWSSGGIVGRVHVKNENSQVE